MMGSFAMGRLSEILDKPKALLPLWLLAALVIGATVIAAAASELGAPPGIAAAVAAVVSWGGAWAARLSMARRGRAGFDELPSAEYDSSLRVRAVSKTLSTAAWLTCAVVAYFVARAVGLGGHGDLWFLPALVAVAAIAAAPAMTEADARHGLRVQRRRQAEEARIRGEAPASAEEPALAEVLEEATAADSELVVPLRRGVAWAWFAGMVAAGIGCGLLAAFASGMGLFERIVVGVGAPLFVFVGFQYVRIARAPYFLRVTATGADLMGAGEIPWDAIGAADITAYTYGRALCFVFAEDLPRDGSAPAWATPEIRRLARRSKGMRVEGMLRMSAWPGERVAARLRRTGRVEVDAFLA